MGFLTDLLEMNQFPLAGSVADWGYPMVSLHRQRPSYLITVWCFIPAVWHSNSPYATEGFPNESLLGAHLPPHKTRSQ
jgi:hypothetical protein